jgi:hypothetical protein
MKSTTIKKIVFVMKPERVEELLLSYRFHEGKLKERGYELTGIVPVVFK